MTDSFVTQCPHCQTSFRVSYNQLSVARGVVRCGACLQVFNAAQQLLEQSRTADQPARPAKAIAPVETRPVAVSQREWAATELDLDDLQRPPRADTLSASREEEPSDTLTFTDSLSSRTADEPAGDDERSEPIPALLEREPPLADPDAAGDRTEPSLKLSTVGVHDKGHDSLLIEHDDEPVAPRDNRGRNGERSEPSLQHDDSLHDLADDPLQLAWEKNHTPWGKRLLWSLLAVVAAIALAGQYVAYNFAELARQDAYRPWLQQLCPQIGCTVPSKVDIALIKSSNLVVRSHPEFAGALVVDAIIYNRATFSQPFPLLELRFADLNGGLIASRRFKPSEYLAGDLAGQAEMPPQTPIHIALDILDPGPKAVNYSLSFRSPE
ncbi:DUF3426 domain-containing protein [Pseudomonas sp. nanlin1]|uniref:DUF3426 domain-containing protein n=1 Tax=Pseudomonas sp. nanlin1 TaxID=3040605 RepID=UPI00388E3A5F